MQVFSIIKIIPFQHSQRNFFEYETNQLKSSESGFLLLPMDRHSQPDYLVDHMELMAKAELIEDQCVDELFCGMPFYTSRMLRQASYSHWIPAGAPYFNKDVIIQRITNQQPENRYMFQLEGPDSMGILISPEPGVEIESWSFDSEVLSSGMEWKGRPTYFIQYTAGKFNRPMTFHLDLKVPAGWTGKKLALGISAHYTHYDEERTAEFQQFIDSYPDWTHVTAWMASYNGFEF